MVALSSALTLRNVEIEIRDAQLAPIATKIAPTELEFRREWVRPGGWRIQIPSRTAEGTSTVAAQAILQPGAGIIVRHKATGETLLSGPAHTTNYGTQTAARRELAVIDGVPTETIEVSGIDDLGWIGYHDARPEPDGVGTSAYDSRTGAASTILLEFLRWNLGDLALLPRQVPYFVFPVDPVAGETITANPRWTQLLDLARDICKRGNITMDAKQVGRQIAVTVGTPRDLDSDVQFSQAQGTLAEAVIDSSITLATHVIVAGQGVGAARKWVEVGPPPGVVPVRRIERFLDRRDLTTDAQLTQAGETWLRENSGAISLTFKPNVTTTGPVYGRDYQLGDLVGVEVLNLGTNQIDHRTERLIAVTQKWSPDAVDTELTVGASEPFGELASVKSIRRNADELSLLQRSY